MCSSRIVEEESAYYHIWSRVVDRRMVFDMVPPRLCKGGNSGG